jgi:hypothetical protein
MEQHALLFDLHSKAQNASVGAGLLANAECQPTMALNVPIFAGKRAPTGFAQGMRYSKVPFFALGIRGQRSGNVLRRALISNAGKNPCADADYECDATIVGARLPANRLPPQRCIPWLLTYIR